LGIPTPLSRTLWQLVKSKAALVTQTSLIE
jgi:hypothetical protein